MSFTVDVHHHILPDFFWQATNEQHGPVGGIAPARRMPLFIRRPHRIPHFISWDYPIRCWIFRWIRPERSRIYITATPSRIRPM
jgi:hypothetical protein